MRRKSQGAFEYMTPPRGAARHQGECIPLPCRPTPSSARHPRCKRSQGAFEYILLLGGILLIVVVSIIILRNSVLNQANKQIVGNVNVWQGATSATCPNVPCGEGKGCFGGNCYADMLADSDFESASGTLDSEVCATAGSTPIYTSHGSWETAVYYNPSSAGCYAVSTAAHSGSRSIKLSGSWGAIGQINLPFVNGVKYGVSFWYKTASTSQFTAAVDLSGWGSGSERFFSATPINADGQWHYSENVLTMDSTGTYRFYIGYNACCPYVPGGPAYFDEVALVKLS